MSKYVGTGPSSYKKRIYRAAVSLRENLSTYFLFNKFCPKIVPFLDNVEKCHRARHVTDDR